MAKLLDNFVRRTKKITLDREEEMEPMNFPIVGRTGTGKTRLLLRILEDELLDQYDDIFLVCPTYKNNFCYQRWEFKDLLNWHPICCSLDEVDYVLRLILKNVKGKTLVILDDCASSKDTSRQKSSLTYLAQGGRHRQINTIVLTQQITSIAKAYRNNLTRIITFFNPSKLDRRDLFDTMCSHKRSQEEMIMKTLMKNKYSYFDVKLYHPWTCEVVLQDKNGPIDSKGDRMESIDNDRGNQKTERNKK